MPDLPISGLTTLGTQSANDLFVVVEFASGVTKKESRSSIVTGVVSDAVYGAGWNGVVDVSPSKNAVYDKIELLDSLVVHLAGTETITGQKTFNSDIKFPDFTGIADSNGNDIIQFIKVASATKYFTVTNAAGGNPTISVDDGVGGDVHLSLNSSGLGEVKINTHVRITDAQLQAGRLAVTGTAGNGYLDITAQSVDPSSGGLRVFANSVGHLSWKVLASIDGFKRTIDGVLTANRAYTLPDKAMTFAGTNDKLSAFATTTSAELAGVISDETGTGSLVFATSPTLVTPILGVASATSISLLDTTYKVALSTSASLLRLADGAFVQVAVIPTTESSGIGSGALYVVGGFSVAKKTFFGDAVTIVSTASIPFDSQGSVAAGNVRFRVTNVATANVNNQSGTEYTVKNSAGTTFLAADLLSGLTTITAGSEVGEALIRTWSGGALNTRLTLNNSAANFAVDIQRGGTKVIGARVTGWTAATGTATRTTFDTTTVTTAQLAERVKAVIDDLISHGLIGA